MTRQSMFQAKKESQPLQTSSLFRRQAAQAPFEEREAAALPVNLGHDFSGIPFKPVHPAPALGPSSISCPFTPERCPFGGACHACPPKMQAKLKIGQPGDKYEQEADRVAEQVMRMPEPQVQRKCSAPGCKDEDDEKKLLQTKPASAGVAGAQVDHPLIQSVLSSPGQPLDAGTRSFMEPRFGQDFSGVRVHVGGEAAESARAVNARAYTVGRDVVFGEGQYAPGSGEGKRLVAHELVHVGQQARNGNAIHRASYVDIDRPDNPIDRKQMPAEPVVMRKSKTKPKVASPCTRTIFAEGTCQHLVDKAAGRCCDPDNGLLNTNKDVDVEKKECKSHKFTPVFTCDNNCKNAVEKGCDDNDNWMAIPKNQFTKGQCGDIWTICANGAQTKGYVRDKSVTKDRFEVSPGIQSALRVPTGQSFLGAVYKPGVDQKVIDQDKCCASSTPQKAMSGGGVSSEENERVLDASLVDEISDDATSPSGETQSVRTVS